MAKFNLKEHIAKNKATFFGSLTEGQFSWMTQDTGQQIGSQDENMIPVYMFDDKGKYYYENDYEGYGVFGGMDYYELLDKMNGGIGDRSEGIRKAFDKPAVAAGKVLFPALVTDPYKFNYKTHDFTQEAETDPNQSWYEPEEDGDYIMGNDDDDYVNRYGDEDEEELDEIKETKPTTKMKKSELKAKIKEMVLAEIALDIDNMEDAPESEVDFLAELEGMLDEADETEKDTAEVDTTDVAVDDTETVTTSTEVEVDPDVKAVQDALTQAQVAAQKLGDKKLTDQIGNTITFFTREHVVEKPKAAVAEVNEAEGNVMVDSITLTSYIDELISLADDMEYTPDIIKGLQDLKAELPEGKMSVENALDVIKQTIDITGDDIDAIEALGQATDYDDAVIAQARKIYGLDENKKKYYKDAEADDAEHIKALEKDMKDDKKSSELKETLLLQKRAGIITETQYKEKLNEASEDEVPLTSKVKSFINKAIADSKKDGEFENLKKADWFENELIDELIDLFPNKDYDSASKEVMDYIKDKIK